MFVPQRAVVGTGALSVITLAMALVLPHYAAAQSDRAVKNDPRAEFVERNATECAHLERDGVINLPDDAVQRDRRSGASTVHRLQQQRPASVDANRRPAVR